MHRARVRGHILWWLLLAQAASTQNAIPIWNPLFLLTNGAGSREKVLPNEGLQLRPAEDVGPDVAENGQSEQKLSVKRQGGFHTVQL